MIVNWQVCSSKKDMNSLVYISILQKKKYFLITNFLFYICLNFSFFVIYVTKNFPPTCRPYKLHLWAFLFCTNFLFVGFIKQLRKCSSFGMDFATPPLLMMQRTSEIYFHLFPKWNYDNSQNVLLTPSFFYGICMMWNKFDQCLLSVMANQYNFGFPASMMDVIFPKEATQWP